MDSHTLGWLLLGGGGLAVVGYVLHKVGRFLLKAAEVAAAIAAVGVALWWVGKGIVWVCWQVISHPRTSIALMLGLCWWHWWGWPSLAITATVVTLGLVVWHFEHVETFDRYVGRYLRAWWLRWTLYARKLPRWLNACGLVIHQHHEQRQQPSASRSLVTVNRGGGRRPRKASAKDRRRTTPRILGVTSGPSWDQVRVRTVPGQAPEDFDAQARRLASARGVARCQVREVKPNVVSLDFQRRDLLAETVPATDLTTLSDVNGAGIDLRKVYAGRTEYGNDYRVNLTGLSTLHAGSSGAGKNSAMWCPLSSVAPAIRDGLVRVSGIDPKAMELAYGRSIFTRYAVTGTDAVALLDDVIAVMEARKETYRGRMRAVDLSAECPLELIEFDEIGALTKYIGNRRVQQEIEERVGLITSQGRALGVVLRGYVQEPTKDTVPFRELFPRRVALRLATVSQVDMVLGDGAYERGAWANRIGEHQAGVAYVLGEGIREPLRVRYGWVPDEQVKALETFITQPDQDTGEAGQVIELPGARDDYEADDGSGAA